MNGDILGDKQNLQQELRYYLDGNEQDIQIAYEARRYSVAMKCILDLADYINFYIDEKAPKDFN